MSEEVQSLTLGGDLLVLSLITADSCSVFQSQTIILKRLSKRLTSSQTGFWCFLRNMQLIYSYDPELRSTMVRPTKKNNLILIPGNLSVITYYTFVPIVLMYNVAYFPTFVQRYI